jgi:hypothetical protein
MLAAAAGEAVRARAAIVTSLRLESKTDDPDGHGESHRAGADVEKRLGNAAKAREHLLAARRLFEAKGNIVRVEEVTSRLQAAG